MGQNMAILTLTGAPELEAKLHQLSTQVQNLSVPFKRATVIIFASVKQNFAAGGRPTAWPPITYRQGETLRDTGRLMASITSGAADGSILTEEHTGGKHILTIGTAVKAVGTNVTYANVHQFGFNGPQQVKAHGRVQRMAFGRAMSPRRVEVRAHTRQMKIPPRPFLLLQEADAADLQAMFAEYLFKVQ